MIEEPPLLTIKRTMRRPTRRQVDAFHGASTGFVVDAMLGGGALASDISPIGDGHDIDCRAVGPALTVDCGPADVLALLAALELTGDGDVVIAAFHGHQGCAAAGDNIAAMLKNCGAAGFVTDGPVRDYVGIVGTGLPVWCAGLTPNTPFTNGPGKVGLPIQIGGQRVETGDMIVADRDGVVVVPFDGIDTVIATLAKVTELESALDGEIRNGLKIPAQIREIMVSDRVRYID
ncbi:MAG: RraA family protein [Rhodobacter sp.]|nr:RraA family protein [Rhodobacter sp.]MCY4167374.1 RraA family protein [Rhodobacter sp.]MCY4243571.1 RraA family protein [Rhodobacter sp.]